MANRFAWWMIPASVVVLVRVVTLPVDPVDPVDPVRVEVASPAPAGETAAPTRAAAPVAAVAPTGPVVLRDAAGARSGPIWLLGADATILRLPAAAAGTRADFTVERYGGGGAREQWLAGTARVRDDATMPFLGLQPGRYSVVVAFARGDETVRLTGDVEAGGTLDLR